MSRNWHSDAPDSLADKYFPWGSHQISCLTNRRIDRKQVLQSVLVVVWFLGHITFRLIHKSFTFFFYWLSSQQPSLKPDIILSVNLTQHMSSSYLSVNQSVIKSVTKQVIVSHRERERGENKKKRGCRREGWIWGSGDAFPISHCSAGSSPSLGSQPASSRPVCERRAEPAPRHCWELDHEGRGARSPAPSPTNVEDLSLRAREREREADQTGYVTCHSGPSTELFLWSLLLQRVFLYFLST